MSRFLTLATACALAICVGATWSYGDQAGGGAGGSGGAGGQAGGAGGAGQAGGTGGTGQAGAAGQVGGAGTAGAQGQGQAGITPQPNNMPNNFNNFGVGRRAFFADPNVQRQLNLNQNQFNQLDRSYQDAWGNYNRGQTEMQANLTDQQRAEQMMMMQNRFNQDFGRSIDSTFTDPRARARFNQLSLQFQGPAAFNDPNIRQQLNITPQQQRDFRRLSAEWRQQLQRLRRAGNDADPQVTQQQYAQLQQRLNQQMTASLTPEQQQQWQQIYGTPFVYPFNSYFDDVESPTRGQPDDPSTAVPRVGLGQQPATQPQQNGTQTQQQ